jgi:glutamate dehydrogenase
MSGDVFGNGMLLSPHIQLIGAFDHRHVFLDPNPDAAASFVERRRLFQLPGSSSEDYDPGLISAGGGVFPRTAKAVPLSPEARAALGVQAETLTPSELIHALLHAPVDLLWNGGIGTYVKAKDERHAEVGDRANDAVRVNAEELRCRVVGEGGNLGFTQRARVAYARGGGRIYMDAIDNSAGVDCSDHEVNIKILLDTIVADGDLTGKQRNAILAEMGDEVAALVLRDNYEQTQAISSSTAQAGSMIEVHERYVRSLEQDGTLNRELEVLPTDEGFDERQAVGGGLTTPEFAILLSHTKLALGQALLASDLPEDPYLSSELERYFPARLGDEFGTQLQRHPLRREIIASRVVNDLVNRAGTTFAFRLGDETGAGADDIARAYAVAREVFGLRGLWAEIEALDGRVPAATQTAMLLRARILLERATRWLLRNRRRPIDIAAAVARYSAGAAALAEALPRLLGPSEVEAARARAARFEEVGVSSELAQRVAHLELLVPTLDLVEIAAAAEVDVAAAAAVYFALGARLELHWLRDRIVDLPRETRWEAMAREALRDDVYSEQAGLTPRCCGRCGRRALAGRERERDREIAAGARRHQERRRPRPRSAVRRRARDPQPDPLERNAGAGRSAGIPPVDRLLDLEPLVCELEGLDRDLVAAPVQRRAFDLHGPRAPEQPAVHGLPLLVEQRDRHVAPHHLAVSNRLPPLEEVGAPGDSALERDVRVLGEARKLACAVDPVGALPVLDHLDLARRHLGLAEAQLVPDADVDDEVEVQVRVVTLDAHCQEPPSR